ncbi:hypothetical protein D6779_03380 [Candidatus Parcubacteria bacterium]|nr:MAG: hypothetical protein D6779_03380 [Candidatus Parcubacteria bacterium]
MEHRSKFYISRRTKLLIVFFGVVVVSYSLTRIMNGSASIPTEFQEAREQGAIIAQNIVSLSNDSSKILKRISELDKEKRYIEAVAEAKKMLEKSAAVRNEAVKLAAELEKMTKALDSIKGGKAKNAALESITNWVALMNRLVDYSASLSRLSEVLQARFENRPTDQQVGVLIEQVNAEIRSINNFNEQARQAIRRMDFLVR